MGKPQLGLVIPGLCPKSSMNPSLFRAPISSRARILGFPFIQELSSTCTPRMLCRQREAGKPGIFQKCHAAMD